jgi:hypothetical protein
MAISSRASSSPSGRRSRKVRSNLDVIVAWVLVASCVALAILLASCKNVLNDEDESFHLRVVNLLEDSPSVLYYVDTTSITSAGYSGATALGAARPGNHTVSFKAVRPASLNSDDTTDPIELGGSFSKDYGRDRDYTVFTYGRLNDVHTFVIDEPSDKDDVEDDFIEWQMVNAAPNLPRVDVYLTAPEANINAPEKVATISFGDKTTTSKLKLFRRSDVTDEDAALIVDMTFELRDPSTGTRLYNSGKLRLGEKTRLLFAIARNIAPGPSGVVLMGLDGYSNTVPDIDDQAAVRVVHVSNDTPALDIIRGSSLNTPIAQNISFRDTSAYVSVPKGEIDLIAVPTGGTNVFLFVEEFTASVHGSYSAYAIGPLATVDARVINDDRRSVPTQTKFRFLNAAPSQEDEDGVDIYVTLPGQALDFDSTDDTNTKDDAPQFRRATALGFTLSSDYVTLKSGTYQVRVAATGTSRMLLDTQIAVVDGSVQTLVLNDDPGTADLELMGVDEALL